MEIIRIWILIKLLEWCEWCVNDPDPEFTEEDNAEVNECIWYIKNELLSLGILLA